MALPPEISTVLMTGTLVDDEGNPLVGMVRLTPSVPQLVSPSTNRIIQLYPRSIMLDENGYFETELIATGEPDVLPPGVYWTLEYSVPNKVKLATFHFTVPYGLTTADISQYVIAVQTADSEQAQYLVGYRGASAYDIAVSNGFTGTVEQWLASLSENSVQIVDGPIRMWKPSTVFPTVGVQEGDLFPYLGSA